MSTGAKPAPPAPEFTGGSDEAASLVALLGGSPSERSSAYLVFEATSDVELAVACAGPLIERLGAPASVVGAAEHRRCSLALAHLASLDPVRVGAEWYSGLRFLTAYAKGNAIDAILSKPLQQITAADDMRTYAAAQGVAAAISVRGWSAPIDASSSSFSEVAVAAMTQDNVSAQMMQISDDEPTKLRVVTLVLELLREHRADLSEAEATGAFQTVRAAAAGAPAVALHAAQAGAVGLAIAELRTGTPIDWVALKRNPVGRFGAALQTVYIIALSLAAEHRVLVAAEPGLMAVCLEALQAYETVGPADANAATVIAAIGALYEALSPLLALGGGNLAVVRGAASSVRFVLDHPLVWIREIGITTTIAAVLPYLSTRFFRCF